MDVLKEKGYRIAKASNGQEAITMVREAEFDLVFIDVKMPVMNGLEIYLTLKKIRPDIKAIMMTGYRQEVQDLVGEAIKNNAYTCIYKPFDIGKVLLLIEEILFKKPAAEISRTEVN
jgi:DNA-binding NtrC family response regulator